MKNNVNKTTITEHSYRCSCITAREVTSLALPVCVCDFFILTKCIVYKAVVMEVLGNIANIFKQRVYICWKFLIIIVWKIIRVFVGISKLNSTLVMMMFRLRWVYQCFLATIISSRRLFWLGHLATVGWMAIVILKRCFCVGCLNVDHMWARYETFTYYWKWVVCGSTRRHYLCMVYPTLSGLVQIKLFCDPCNRYFR